MSDTIKQGLIALVIAAVCSFGTFMLSTSNTEGIVNTKIEAIEKQQAIDSEVNKQVLQIASTQNHLAQNMAAIGVALQAATTRVTQLEQNSAVDRELVAQLKEVLGKIDITLDNVNETVIGLDIRVKHVENTVNNLADITEETRD